jgi:hypothetical protein
LEQKNQQEGNLGKQVKLGHVDFNYQQGHYPTVDKVKKVSLLAN